ncbi:MULTISPECIES: LysM peptidoglycan-binding domain-containing protein [Microbacterium]|uniref:LysM peptidoglycan-binding domain-containing protein n=1 Tax=Microbacterium wangchenii TaxID=2541726 RepID=A0ABX5SQB0_9MICO|nr:MULTISPECIES: LysM peptidoglycan-binding domain-containing protein [Microbacterium]MCK6067037.1 LysM peptidoglycan-binding domain-containing protein [Microbacterium sp. EYE_512]QBR88328.1 LysM peptidoglycan-binding domain-containing protein [Microbacterium wangchenii]TFV83550.1 LysM peptidoglycan-binding domain-containing protein [Microbacterium sp. dk485]TXK17881.1 LysM peptidoglycan-binding domain-containing protein [Microbacterium wangchenii]
MATIASVAPTTRLRLTARGRRLLAGLAALPAAIAIALAVLGGGAALASAEGGAPAGTFTEITVMSGESLWSIAQDLAPHADPRDVVEDIARLNVLESSTVSAGQRLAIPVEYAPQS